MSNSATENPVLLWGDMGPDVYILSQIYDPRNDRYVETQDTTLQSGKVYYERLQLILTTDTVVHEGRDYYERVVDPVTGDVVFNKVTPALGDNPAQKGWYMDSGGKIYVFSAVDLTKYPPTTNPLLNFWYQVNPDAQNTCGKYVPAVNSLVVVDEDECDYKTENNYKTRMILIVKSVDKAFNVTFACAEFGLNIEDTERSIDYGNEKFYLFFDRKAAGRHDVLLTPDRKLMLYGKNSYGYRLKRDGAIISTNLPTIQTREDAFVPYARATGKRVLVTEENYKLLQGAYLDVLLPNGLQRVVQLPEDTRTLVPTFDITFRKNVRYYTTLNGELVGSILDTEGLCGKVIDPANNYDVGIVGDDGNPVLFNTFYEKSGDTYTVTTDRIFVAGKAYYVLYKEEYKYANTEKLTGSRIIDWEKADPKGRKVCRCIGQDRLTGDWDGDIIGRVAHVHMNAQQAVNNVFLPNRCCLKSNHSIVEGETILMEVFSFDYNTNEANLIMSLEIIAKEATALDTTDVTTRQIVRFDVELNGSDRAGDIWYLQQGQNWREVFDMVPKISFDDGSDMVVPIDGKVCYAYGFENIKSGLIGREYQVLFKFFPHKTMNIDWQKIGLTPTKNYMTVRKTVKIINDLSMRIRKISLIPAWNYANQQYDLYFMIFRTDFMAPPITRQSVDTKYTIQVYVPTTDTKATVYTKGSHAGELKTYYYKVNTGNFIDLNLHLNDPIQPQREIYGEVYEKQELPKTTIEDVQYMNDNGNIEYVPASAVGKLSYIQRGTLAEKVVIDNVTAASVYTQPILFKLSPMDFNSDPFKWLIGDDKTGYQFIQIPYGKSPRPFLRFKEEEVEVVQEDGETTKIVKSGAYRIDPSKFANVQQVLAAFYEAGNPPHGVSEEGVVDDEEFTPTHFYIRACSDDSACSGFISLTNPSEDDKGDNYRAAALMAGGGRADEVSGGAMPVQIEDPVYGQGTVNLMGTVIVEFVHRYVDPDDASKYLYKHLWAVPVEVIDETWPRSGDL